MRRKVEEEVKKGEGSSEEEVAADVGSEVDSPASTQPENAEVATPRSESVPRKVLADVDAGSANEEEIRELRSDRLEEASDKDVTAALVAYLEERMERSLRDGEARSVTTAERQLRFFFSTAAQSFGFVSYVARIVDGVQCRGVLAIALHYIELLREARADLALSEGNVHRVLTTAVTLAFKYHEDEPVKQEFFRAIGLIPTESELNELEKEFIRLVGWKFFLHPRVFDSYSEELLERVVAEERKR